MPNPSHPPQARPPEPAEAGLHERLLGGRADDEGWSSAAALLTTPAGELREFADGPRTADGTGAAGRTGPASRFDLASVTKTFVAVAAAPAIDGGLLDLDAPARETLDVPATAAGATPRQLLTHSAGLRDSSLVWRTTSDPAAVLDDALGPPVDPPGAVHRYSCLSFIVLGRLLEELTGERLDRLVAGRVAEPIGATGLRWSPVSGDGDPADLVPTEPGTPTGRVHDELAAALGSPVGNAGLFGTLDDVGRLASLVASRGVVGGRRVVSEESWRALVEPDGGAGRAGAPWGQALGLRRGDPGFMVTGDQVGHTGFTGTSFVVDLATGASAVLLTNRVHAGRGASVQRRRQRLAALAARGASQPDKHTEVRG